VFSDYFDVQMSKIIFKKLKKYYFEYFKVKNILKSNSYYIKKRK